MKISQVLKKFIPERWRPYAEQVYFILRTPFYFGNNIECLCCGGSFRKFVPFAGRDNARCPRCGSFERHRLLYLYLEQRTNFFESNLKVLDIAPNIFFQRTCRSMRNLTYVSADISSPVAEFKTDITNLCFDDEEFDCLFCYHVLEHVINDIKAMRELFSVLKPGGWGVFKFLSIIKLP